MIISMPAKKTIRTIRMSNGPGLPHKQVSIAAGEDFFHSPGSIFLFQVYGGAIFYVIKISE